MSVIIRTTDMKYKDAQGNYVGINGVAERATSEMIADIQAAGADTIADVEAAGADTIADVQQAIAASQAALDGIDAQRNTMIAAIASVAGQGTDTTFTQSGVAADAAEVGKLNSAIVHYPDTIEAATGVRTGIFEPGYYNTPKSGSSVSKQTSESALSGAVTTLLPVNPGDIVTMNNAGGDAGGRAYVFIDSEWKAIGRCDTWLSGLRTVEAPQNAVYVAVNVRLSEMSNGYFAYVFDSIPKKLKETMAYKGEISGMGITSLAAITETGFYTAINGYASSLSDMPEDFTNTRSFCLKVWKNAYYTTGSNKYIRQEIFDDVRDGWMRIIRRDGTVTVDWVKTTAVEKKEFQYNGLIETGTTVIAPIIESGWYTITTLDLANITDLPDGYDKSTTFLLVVFNPAYNGGTESSVYVRQELYDNAGNAWYRIIQLRNGSYYKVHTDWKQTTNVQINDGEFISKLYVSIIGDSNATFAGYIPSENCPYYTGRNLGVNSASKMWWSVARTVAKFNLLINDSWSGSCVTNVRPTIKSQSTIDRTQNLHSYVPGSASDYDLIVTSENIGSLRKSPWFSISDYAVGDYLKEVDPDVVILTGGGNDFVYKAPIGDYDGTQTLTEDTTNFKNAYAIMINRVRERYPKAMIVCAVPYFLVRPDMTNAENQESVNEIGIGYNEYRDAIKEIAELKGCSVISLYDAGFTRYNCYPDLLGDSSTIPTHMTAKGQNILGQYVGSQLLDLFIKHRAYFE